MELTNFSSRASRIIVTCSKRLSPYLEKEIKALKVSFDKGKTFVLPTMATAKDKSYPITRPLYFYYLNTVEKKVTPFVDFLLSAEGQKLVEGIGYVPLTK